MPTDPSRQRAGAVADNLMEQLAGALPSLAVALVILAAGWWLAGLAAGGIGRLIDRQSRIDPMLRGVATALVRYAIIVLSVIAALG